MGQPLTDPSTTSDPLHTVWTRQTSRHIDLPRLSLRLKHPTADRLFRPARLVESLSEGGPLTRYSVQVRGPVQTAGGVDHLTAEGADSWSSTSVTGLLTSGMPLELLDYILGPDDLHERVVGA